MTTITILSALDCHLCDHARAVVDRISREYRLEVEDMPITSPRGRELALAVAMPFPPAVLIDGQPFAYGRLSEGRLRRELATRTARRP